MRLIDADKLVELCQKGWKLFGFHDEKRVHWVDACDIREQPTIEAIPVEWLKTQIEKCQEISNTSKTVGLAILAETIKQWEKENEK